MPAPVVAVQDIVTQGNSYVQVREAANFKKAKAPLLWRGLLLFCKTFYVFLYFARFGGIYFFYRSYCRKF